ncbi:MAG: hypothetical protein K1W01_05960 [Muribaculaceae bacterium]
MAKKDEIQGVQCENADFEIMRRQLARLEKMLTDKFTEVNDRIGNITVQAPAFSPPAEPQQPIEVSLPENIASREDIRAISGVIQTLNGTVSLVMKSLAEIQKAFAAMPRPDVEAIATDAAMKAAQATADKVISDLTPKIDNSADKAVRLGAVKTTGISFDDAASIHKTMKEMNKKIDVQKDYVRLRKVNRNLIIGIMVVFNIACLLGWGANELWKERKELMRVEWLYRGLRSMINPKDTTSLYGMEQSILLGTKEQRESWQTTIVNHEAVGIPFHKFQPHEDWKPEPPKPKTEKPNPKKEAEIDRFPLPHQRNSRLTPGEVQAIKDMRASPNIPEEAKPELPEGYE